LSLKSVSTAVLLLLIVSGSGLAAVRAWPNVSPDGINSQLPDEANVRTAGQSPATAEDPDDKPLPDAPGDREDKGGESGEPGDDVLVGAAGLDEDEQAGAEAGHGIGLGTELPLWSVIPFIGILLSIAVLPLILPRIWHHYFPAISAFWALVFAVPFLLCYGKVAIREILHIYLVDYIPFIILLWGLFTISGGIVIKGSLKGSPLVNTVLLIIGTAIASWIGTTGASMLLIRPLIRANAWRERKVHIIIFFIFLVSNIGGSLTPLGDPPLFLGFLHGVPFFWTFNLLPHMALASLLLLALFYFFDSYYFRREDLSRRSPEKEKIPFRIEGAHNAIFLAGVIGAVLMSGLVHLGHLNVLGVHVATESLMRDGIIVAMGLFSLYTTSKAVRESNEFSWFPIKEVAYLFAGIFMTIIPALAILKAGSQGGLSFLVENVSAPMDYFWITGILSSFLDNAPTYLTFLNTALGTYFANLGEHEAIAGLIAQKGVYLEAISAGAVFMGANTYIGNAPNFMVKSIAEESGVPMPSFFGFMIKYSIPILIPLFVFVTIVFFLV